MRKLDNAWRTQYADSPTCEYLGVDGAFNVLMGGLEVPSTMPSTHKLVTLSAENFLKYLNSGRISDKYLHKDKIVDKGKSSNIPKLLSDFQAFWFLAQCLGRWYIELPLTWCAHSPRIL